MHKGAALIAAMAWSTLPVYAHAAQACDQLPPSVQDHAVYAGWSGCAVIEAGERRLWKGLGKDETRVMRFTFTQGHSQFWRFVTITERADKSGSLRIGGGGRNEDDFIRHRKLTAEQIAHLNQLAEQAGA